MKLEILRYPDKRLRTVAKPITKIDREIRTLADDLFETMYAAPGIGLAATQVDRHIRLAVIDVSAAKNQPLVLVNPKIIERTGEGGIEEGCLSVPDYAQKVVRAEKIKIAAKNLEGRFFELEAEGLLSICIQHEIDHLNGILFVDYLSKLKRQRLLEKSKKNQASSGL